MSNIKVVILVVMSAFFSSMIAYDLGARYGAHRLAELMITQQAMSLCSDGTYWWPARRTDDGGSQCFMKDKP